MALWLYVQQNKFSAGYPGNLESMSKNTTGIMKKYSLHFKEHKMSGMHSRNLIPSPLEGSVFKTIKTGLGVFYILPLLLSYLLIKLPLINIQSFKEPTYPLLTDQNYKVFNELIHT